MKVNKHISDLDVAEFLLHSLCTVLFWCKALVSFPSRCTVSSLTAQIYFVFYSEYLSVRQLLMQEWIIAKITSSVVRCCILSVLTCLPVKWKCHSGWRVLCTYKHNSQFLETTFSFFLEKSAAPSKGCSSLQHTWAKFSSLQGWTCTWDACDRLIEAAIPAWSHTLFNLRHCKRPFQPMVEMAEMVELITIENESLHRLPVWKGVNVTSPIRGW